MVNDYYIKDNSSTAMAQSESLFISCKTHDIELTKEVFRRNIDTAFITLSDFMTKKGKVNKVEEIKPVASSDHEPCGTCGSTDFLRTGTCFVCRNCSSSQGCS
jgi:formamidopyrimidine-DNA glycosylase